ncbi:hypothetical protein CARUB_v100195352mg, partial [Capsella rubella]
ISRNIEYLNIIGTAVKEVPMSIMSWSRLSDFRISYFESLKDFPFALDIITELQLNKDIQEVAPWVKEMSRLRVLKLDNCKNLVSLPQFSDSLSCIDADNCKSLERLDCSFNNPEIRLKFTNCFKLNQEAKDLIMHTSTRGYAILPGAQVPACFNHRAIGGSLKSNFSVWVFKDQSYKQFLSYLSMQPLRNLRWMYLSYSTDLKELPDISTATNLETLYLEKCSSLVELPSCIGELTSLRVLDLNGCSSLVKIPTSIENTTNLRRLVLSGCDNVVELPSIGNETKLEQLILNNCSRLVKLPSSINATNLQEMSLSNCSLVVELPTIENANNLNILDLNNCSSLLELPPSIGTAKNLEKLDISGCLSILELPSSIGNLQRLSTLTMCGCSKLEALPTNINLKSLDRLDLSDCSELKSIPEISRNIEYLNIIGTAVKEVPMSIMSWSRLSDF